MARILHSMEEATENGEFGGASKLPQHQPLSDKSNPLLDTKVQRKFI